MTLSSSRRIAPPLLAVPPHFLRRAIEVARRAAPLLALAAIHRQLDGVAGGQAERLVLVQQRLHRVLAGRQLAQRLERVAEHAGVERPLVARLQPLDVDAEDLRRRQARGAHLEPRLAGAVLRQATAAAVRRAAPSRRLAARRTTIPAGACAAEPMRTPAGAALVINSPQSTQVRRRRISGLLTVHNTAGRLWWGSIAASMGKPGEAEAFWARHEPARNRASFSRAPDATPAWPSAILSNLSDSRARSESRFRPASSEKGRARWPHRPSCA